MSHNIILSKVKFKDLTVLGQVASDLSNGKCILDATAKEFRTYYNQDPKCDGMIKMDGAFDIGLKKTTDGYVPVADFSMMRNSNPFSAGGNDVGKLQQEYILREAEYTAAQNGMTSERIQGKNGKVTLELVASN